MPYWTSLYDPDWRGEYEDRYDLNLKKHTYMKKALASLRRQMSKYSYDGCLFDAEPPHGMTKKVPSSFIGSVIKERMHGFTGRTIYVFYEKSTHAKYQVMADGSLKKIF